MSESCHKVEVEQGGEPHNAGGLKACLWRRLISLLHVMVLRKVCFMVPAFVTGLESHRARLGHCDTGRRCHRGVVKPETEIVAPNDPGP